MTYTFKLARRLAVSRDFAMIAVLALLVACMEDSTGPDSPRAPDPGLQIIPRSVTVETNQPIRFRGQTRTLRGEVVSVPITWKVSGGGSIQADGTFSSAAVGSFTVVGRAHRGSKTDSSLVLVVPPQLNAKSITIAPANVSLSLGATQVFTAAAQLNNGSKGATGVVWSASGGIIDPDGSYHAGTTPGNFQVIAANTSGSLADTASVTITPPTASDPDPGPPPPVPTLARVVVWPASPTLLTGGARQFRAYGKTSLGDSVAVVASFRATGGTITAAGLYTAGPTAGTYSVIATSSGLADTAVVTLTPPSGSGGTTDEVGIPMSLSNLLATGINPSPYTGSLDAYSASNIVSRLADARSRKLRVLMNLTPGHEPYLTGGVFDRSKWEAKMDTYNSSVIRSAIAAAVADGTIIGASVMDEPNVYGLGDGNTWGPPGTMNKARVDTLCGYLKAMFPTLPAGVVARHDVFDPTRGYRVCDFIVSQYVARAGDVRAFRDAALAMGRRDGHAVMFSMNLLNGGTPDRDGIWDCPLSTTGGKGQQAPSCRMSARQVEEVGLVLGAAGCGINMWRYDATFFSRPDNRAAAERVADSLGKLPRRTCTRS